MELKQKIQSHFKGRWEDFYRDLVELPSNHNGNVKIHSPLRSDDTQPSFQITFQGPYAGRWKDYGTGEGGDHIDFYRHINDCGYSEALNRIAAKFGIDSKLRPDPENNKLDRPKQVKTLKQRGISQTTARAFNITEAPGNKRVTHCITFPIYDREGTQIGTKTHKAGQTKGNTAQIYPWKALDSEIVYLINGEPSVWRAWESGYKSLLCSTGGESTFKADWVVYFQNKHVRLVLDNDATGSKAMAKIARMLFSVASTVKVIQWPKDFVDKGDVEDWLNAGKRLEDLEFVQWEPSTDRDDNERVSGSYRIQNGQLGYMKTVGRSDDAIEIFSPLCNFVAHITEDIKRDNGVEEIRRFLVTGKLDNGQTLPAIEVPASQFGLMNWPMSQWGAMARLVAGSGSKDRLRDAMQVISIDTGIDSRTIYTHTGWRKIHTKWSYLYAGGSIGGTDVEVDLEPPLDRYALPKVEDVVGAVQQSLSLLDVAPLSVTVPLLAAVALAPLSELLRPDFALWIFGPTGSLKTTLAALFSSHFGDFPDKNALPASWESTGNALERILFTLKDTLAVIDDYAPQVDPTAQSKVERAMSQVVRSAGNLSGRSRMKSDTSLRRSFPPRCLMLATGEDLPITQSLLARLFTFEVAKGTVNIPELTLAQNHADKLSQAMAGYIEWLAPQIDELGDKLQKTWRQHRNDASKDAPHMRVPEQVAYLATGLDTYLRFATEVNAISDTKAKQLYQDAWGTLLDVGRIHGQRVVEVDPAERFLSVLSSLFASEEVYADWKTLQRHPNDPKPHGNMIGWQDEDYYYLIPDATRAVIATALRAAGDHWPHSNDALYRALDKRGVLVKGTDRSPVQVKIQGRNRRVMKLSRVGVEGEGNTEVTQK